MTKRLSQQTTQKIASTATQLVKQAALATSTIKTITPVVSGLTKSIDKVLGQGKSALKAGRLANKTPAIKNVANAIKTTKGLTSGGSTTAAPLAKTAASRMGKHVIKALGLTPKEVSIETFNLLKKLHPKGTPTDLIRKASYERYNPKSLQELQRIFKVKPNEVKPSVAFKGLPDGKPWGNKVNAVKGSEGYSYANAKVRNDNVIHDIVNEAMSPKQQAMHKKINERMTKNSSYHGETMNTPFITNAYQTGVYDALTKVANMGQPGMMPLQQPPIPIDPNTGMPIDPNTGMPIQVPPMPPAPAPAGLPVAPQMGDVQANMGAPLPVQPAPEATPDELQQVQNSGITPKDIESAAKVIQTVAEMKANADMMQMQPQDPAAMGQPFMAGGGNQPQG